MMPLKKLKKLKIKIQVPTGTDSNTGVELLLGVEDLLLSDLAYLRYLMS